MYQNYISDADRDYPDSFYKMIYPKQLLFQASAAAWRLNENTYRKCGIYSNAALMMSILDDQSRIVEQDKILAEKIINYFCSLLLNLIANKYVSRYERTMTKLIVSQDLIESSFMFEIAEAPKWCHDKLKKQQIENQIICANEKNSEFIGDRIKFSGTIISNEYSTVWKKYFITVITDQNQIVRFSHDRYVSNPDNRVFGTGKIKIYQYFDITVLHRVELEKLSENSSRRTHNLD